MHGTNEAPYDYVNGNKPAGSNSQWNMIPCTQRENVTWKKSKYQDIHKLRMCI